MYSVLLPRLLLMGRWGARPVRTVVAVAASVAVIGGGAAWGPQIIGSGGGGAPAGTANIWIDTNGGTCVDSATPVSYSDSTACSWSGANATCDNGDTVLVKAGSYGTVSFRGSNGRTAACLITVAAGETVTTGNFEMGIWQTCSTGAASTTTVNWLTLTGPIQTSEFHADCSSHITIDNMDMNAGGVAVTQPWNAQAGTTYFTYKNGKIHNALNPNAMAIVGGNGPFVIDNNDIYDDLNNTGGAIHDECFRGESAQNVTLTRNHFWSCNVMDVFITGANLATNWVVENNIFEPPTGSAGNSENGFAFRAGGSPSPSPDGFVMRYNTFANTGVQLPDGQPTANGFVVEGNYFGVNPPCGLSNTTYSYNVSPTGVSNCGGTGAQSFSASSINAGFTTNRPYSGNGGSTAEPAGDYHLLTGSPLKNVGNTSSYPTLDRDGNARYSGSGPDVGAYEFQGG